MNGCLTVLSASAAGAAPWRPLVAEVADLLGLEPAAMFVPGLDTGPDYPQAVLDAAAAVEGPVLVLPGGPAPPPVARTGRPLGRLLVPFDRSRAEAAVLEPLIRRALDEGVEVDQIHVLCEASTPAMWEGPGHPARAWHEELRRRHHVTGATLRVQSGEPAGVIQLLGSGADALVVCWGGESASGRATLLKQLLASIPAPVLLVRSAARPVGAGR